MADHPRETQRKRPMDLAGSRARISVTTTLLGSASAPMSLSAAMSSSVFTAHYHAPLPPAIAAAVRRSSEIKRVGNERGKVPRPRSVYYQIWNSSHRLTAQAKYPTGLGPTSHSNVLHQCNKSTLSKYENVNALRRHLQVSVFTGLTAPPADDPACPQAGASGKRWHSTL